MDARVLVVDDEPDLVELVRYNLTEAGFRVSEARTGAEALAAVRRSVPDVLILDLMLPDLSGTEVCRRLRNESELVDLPIIMLTAKSEEIDRVVGFELGADDYVTKPFSPRELVLRVRAVLRRRVQGEVGERPLEHGPLRLEPGTHRCLVGGREVSRLGRAAAAPLLVVGDGPIGRLTLILARRAGVPAVWLVGGREGSVTAREFQLLAALMLRPGRVMTRDRLLDEVWGRDITVTSRTIDTHLKRLREKLNEAGMLIETVRGVGYRFAE